MNLLPIVSELCYSIALLLILGSLQVNDHELVTPMTSIDRSRFDQRTQLIFRESEFPNQFMVQ